MWKYLLPMTLLACGGPPSDTGASAPTDPVVGDDDDSGDDDTTPPTIPTYDGCPIDAPPTDTIPSFCGEVPKNVLFLSIDTFRKIWLGRFGDKAVTPFLDSLTNTGFILEDHAQCSNWTYAGTTCTLLGRHNEEADFMAKLTDLFLEPVPADTPFLATHLGEAGYWNALVSSNSWLGPQYGNDQGYDVSMNGGGRVRGVWDLAQVELLAAIADGRVTDDGWFLHMHFLDPHSPYNAPDEYNIGYADLPPVAWDLKKFEEHYEMIAQWPTLTPEDQANVLEHLTVLYSGEIAFTDLQLQEIWGELDGLGWLDDTLVVVWNDHGEGFFEHGTSTHAQWLYAEENDAFAFFWAKNIVPGSWPGPTSAIDLAPTVLGLMDLPIPPEMTGVQVGQAPDDRPRFATTYARKGVVQSVTQHDLRMQFRWLTGEVIVTDRAADPLELTNLYDPENISPEVAALWDLLLPRIEMTTPLAPEKSILWPAGLPEAGEAGTP